MAVADTKSDRDLGSLLLILSAFTAISLFPIPNEIRPIFLTIGSFGLLLYSILFSIKKSLSYNSFVFILSIVIFSFWLFAFPVAINGNDDNMAYLIFADDFYDNFHKTIQPLSERRLFSVGGVYAFQAPFMHWLGLSGLQLVEPAFGILLFIAIFLSGQKMPAAGAICGLALIAIMPAMGSSVLANTSSTFILGAISFALVATVMRVSSSKNPSHLDIALIIALPLAATLFRPTTAPFNALISGGAVIYLMMRNILSFKQLSIALIPAIITFFLALLPYHGVGETYLYPILGKGSHVSADRDFFVGIEELGRHASNLLSAISHSPLFLGATACAICAVVLGDRASRPAMAAILLAFVAFAVLTVVATDGLASMRYVAPVSMAVLFASLKVVLVAMASPVDRLEKRIPWLGAITVLGTLLGLLAIRGFSQDVVDKRLETHAIPKEEDRLLARIAGAIRENTRAEEKVLLAGIHQGRFLLHHLNREVLIMDQPGMLLPWRPEITNYADGLMSYLKSQNVRAILSLPLKCGAQRIKQSPKGWAEYIQFAHMTNEAALCTFPGKRIRFDGYELIIL
jgi:hypothetical protein